nr:MAG TPA: hypothetical protein [Caudoviricetes sp.]
MAENYQVQAFWLRASNSAPETVARYRYNYIDIILSVMPYRYRCIDRLLSIRCYRICVRLYGGARPCYNARMFVCAIYIKQPVIFVQIVDPKKNRCFCL